MPLNDTGQTRCFNGSELVTCASSNSGDAASYPRQDARLGRDAQATVGTLSKTGGGNGGFDFTPLDADGNPIALDGSGNPTATPSCVKDNITNLIWEVKTSTNKFDSYSWADATNVYAASKNTGAGLCGYISGWRLPTRRELLSIVDHDQNGSPATDTHFFPNTQGSYYWSSDILAPSPAVAWVVVFDVGSTFANGQTYVNLVRLVRSGQ